MPELAPSVSYSETVHILLSDIMMANFAGVTVAYRGGYGVLFSNSNSAETTHTVRVAEDMPLDHLLLLPGFAAQPGRSTGESPLQQPAKPLGGDKERGSY